VDSLRDQTTNLVLELIRNASRELQAYVGRGPNSYAAGQAAVRGIDAAIELLTRTRVALTADIQGDRRDPMLGVPDHADPTHGNSGPGGRLS
jgi:hypothetical protein